MHKVSMAKRGAIPFSPDWEQVDNMCAIQCTGEEIASVLGIDYDTLQRACKREHKVKFAEYIAQKKVIGHTSLRRSQWKSANSGNVTMQIWLGKNWLGQKDKSDDEIEAMKSPEPIVIVRATKPD